MRASDGCVSYLFGYTWMYFEREEDLGETDRLPLITYFAYMFNETAEAVQCP